MSNSITNNINNAPSGQATRYLLLCSGQDGVGKSSIGINLAIVLARTGKRVCLLDADPGVTNAHHLLGIKPPYSLADVANAECSIRDATSTGPGGIHLAVDGNYRSAIEQLDSANQQRFAQQFSNWEQSYDYILIDSSASDIPGMLYFMEVADELLLILAAKASCLSDSFALLHKHGERHQAKPKHIVINRVQNTSQAELAFEKFRAAMEKYLHDNVLYSGYINQDDAIRNGFALQHPVALYEPEDPSCLHFFQLGQTLETQLMAKTEDRQALCQALGIVLDHSLEPLADTSHKEAEDTPAVKPQQSAKDQFMQLPAQAQTLIESGSLGATELNSVIEALITLGHRAFEQQFRVSNLAPADTSASVPADPTQQSLLDVLEHNRSEGRDLDQLLQDFLSQEQR